jgi:hypothetical protein
MMLQAIRWRKYIPYCAVHPLTYAVKFNLTLAGEVPDFFF